MEKIYRVQMNSKGMPNFSTAVEVADRPQGEWIGARIGHYPGYECSLCHYGVQPWNITRYCPSCGARMKGVDDAI
jgi:hypothetical protein